VSIKKATASEGIQTTIVKSIIEKDKEEDKEVYFFLICLERHCRIMVLDLLNFDLFLFQL